MSVLGFKRYVLNFADGSNQNMFIWMFLNILKTGWKCQGFRHLFQSRILEDKINSEIVNFKYLPLKSAI